MKQPNELRLNNWVIWTNIEIQITTPVLMQRTYNKIDEGRVRGIPLTPEILEKCGFYKNEGSLVYRLEIEYIDESYPCSLQLSGSGIQVCRSGIGAICAPVFHLHQLQNLYFALTGTELNYKP